MRDSASMKLGIKGLATGQRPREKLFNKGAASLSDSRAVGRNTANRPQGQDFAGYCERHAQPLWGLGRSLSGRSR